MTLHQFHLYIVPVLHIGPHKSIVDALHQEFIQQPGGDAKVVEVHQLVKVYSNRRKACNPDVPTAREAFDVDKVVLRQIGHFRPLVLEEITQHHSAKQNQLIGTDLNPSNVANSTETIDIKSQSRYHRIQNHVVYEV